MLEMIEANWPLVLAALLIGIVIAWFVFNVSRKTSVTGTKEDVLDEGAAPAARNQALIDSPPSATTEPVVPASSPITATGSEDGAKVAAKTAVEETAKAPAQEAPSAAPAPQNTTSNADDDLTRIKGVGPKLAAMLSDMGITRFAQIAQWDAAEIARVDGQLGRFQGRIERDNWVEQAGFLAADDREGYESKFGNLD